MPGTRKHPHTRQEWEAIRPIFTRLYQKEGKRLSEVMEIMAARGFHARQGPIQLHYKHRITIWGLDKNKKESDMAFAARVVEERQSHGKDTRLRIRGRTFTPTDVEKYWKRKPLSVEDAASVPHTPPCVEYWTPAPSPAMTGSSELSTSSTQTRKGNEVEDMGTDFLSHDIQALMSVDDLNSTEFAQSPSVPPLMIPNSFRIQEKLIFCANEYTQASFDHYLGMRNTDWSLAENTLVKFLDMASDWLGTVYYGRMPCTAAVLELEIGRMIPGILRQKPLFLLPRLLALGLVVQGTTRSDQYCQSYRKLIMLLKEQAEAVLPSAFPLTILLESVNELLEDLAPDNENDIRSHARFLFNLL
ncbi:hypothetical protein PV05_09515 [Exophiala xenobiotica]|uniref:Clr5 domain-containing protein n=1 Tax=Exophiala xenobiotica TaxID=348802 RepID=A0A0D2CLH7_9EURO|nr:uncharacterized protein PV05_09515 [Exophiala xenobiotica]KIW50727.1 hypothetical protein PV05_09515 [Exophiala xenobiotica]